MKVLFPSNSVFLILIHLICQAITLVPPISPSTTLITNIPDSYSITRTQIYPNKAKTLPADFYVQKLQQQKIQNSQSKNYPQEFQKNQIQNQAISESQQERDNGQYEDFSEDKKDQIIKTDQQIYNNELGKSKPRKLDRQNPKEMGKARIFGYLMLGSSFFVILCISEERKKENSILQKPEEEEGKNLEEVQQNMIM